jgi:hypothetical protein
MNKIIAGIVVLFLIIGIFTFPTTYADDPNDEILDQYNDMMDYRDLGSLILGAGITRRFAQEFKPTVNRLTRAEVYIAKSNMYYLDDYFPDVVYLSILDELNSSALTTVTYPADNLKNYDFDTPKWDAEWIEFDFPDINVIPGRLYYLCLSYYWVSDLPIPLKWNKFIAVCETHSHSIDCYTNGSFWAYGKAPGELGFRWHQVDDPLDDCHRDLLFRTYGYDDENQVEVSINSITGGFGLSASIFNNGIESVYNVNWSIDIEKRFAFILSGDHIAGVIDKISINETVNIQSKDLRGIGLITITVQAENAKKQAIAFLLGPLVLRVNEI